MKLLRTVDGFKVFLEKNTAELGCLADTTFLYALSHEDDRLYNIAIEIADLLAEKSIPIYTNVVGRMEFVDLLFRKQITLGAIELFAALPPISIHKNTYNLLKNIRDQDTAHRRSRNSYKVSENRLKALRIAIEHSPNLLSWEKFCNEYTGSKLFNEWQIMEQELGLNFVELLEGQTSPLFNEPVLWPDMVQLMSDQGMRAPDAMIANLFAKSKFKLFITGDGDFETCFNHSFYDQEDRAILLLS